MEKKQIQRFSQYGKIFLENYIDWSIAFHKDDVSSDEEGYAELTVKWIVGGKKTWLVEEQLDQRPVKDLIINDQ